MSKIVTPRGFLRGKKVKILWKIKTMDRSLQQKYNIISRSRKYDQDVFTNALAVHDAM